jgi:hypothetical protein
MDDTIDPPRTPADDLKDLARIRFRRPLREAENKLLRAAAAGDVAVCGPEQGDALGEVARGRAKGTLRGRIDARVIRWLCVDPRASRHIDPKGIQVYGASIEGELDLSFTNIPFPVSLQQCAIEGQILLISAQLPTLHLGGSRVNSISADGVIVRGSVFLRDRFQANGEVSLIGAQIGGSLECGSGKFINPAEPGKPKTGSAIELDGATVNGAVFFTEGFNSLGEVSMTETRVGSYVDFTRATCNAGPTTAQEADDAPCAIRADGATVKGSVIMRHFRAEGEVRLNEATIGDLLCEDCSFLNPARKGRVGTGIALRCDGLRAPGPVFLRRGFMADGAVRFIGSRLESDVDCAGIFKNPEQANDTRTGTAMDFGRATVAGSFLFRNGAQCEGSVSLTSTSIKGDLDLRATTFQDLDLRNTSTGSILDEHWPPRGKLHLDGFVYGRITESALDPDRRLTWLSLDPDFRTQPYLQLAKVLRATGDDNGARRVLERMARLRATRSHGFQRVWDDALGATIGHGYYPERALLPLLGLSAIGWIIYRRSYLAGAITPKDKDAYDVFVSDGASPEHYPRFSSLIYSLENCFPLVKFGQVDRWQPDPSTHDTARRMVCEVGRDWPKRWRRYCHMLVSMGLRARERGEEPRVHSTRLGTSPRFVRWFIWIQIVLGWLFATLFLVGLSGIVRKD